jgi:hypothetical protein
MLDFYTLAIRLPAIYWFAYFSNRIETTIAVLIDVDIPEKIEAISQCHLCSRYSTSILEVALAEHQYSPRQLQLRLLLICLFYYIRDVNVLFLVPYIFRLP